MTPHPHKPISAIKTARLFNRGITLKQLGAIRHRAIEGSNHTFIEHFSQLLLRDLVEVREHRQIIAKGRHISPSDFFENDRLSTLQARAVAQFKEINASLELTR